MTVSKIMDFKENDLFQENEHISMKLKKCTYSTEITDFNGFSKESLIPFAVSLHKIVYFYKMNRFQWNQLISRNN